MQFINVLSAPIFLERRSAPAPALKKGGPLPHRSFWKKGVALLLRSQIREWHSFIALFKKKYIRRKFFFANFRFKEKKELQKKRKPEKKEGEKRAAPLPLFTLKKEGHSHIAPDDKKEWHSSFARNLGSGTRERRSKECRSCTHCHWVIAQSNL